MQSEHMFELAARNQNGGARRKSHHDRMGDKIHQNPQTG